MTTRYDHDVSLSAGRSLRRRSAVIVAGATFSAAVLHVAPAAPTSRPDVPPLSVATLATAARPDGAAVLHPPQASGSQVVGTRQYQLVRDRSGRTTSTARPAEHHGVAAFEHRAAFGAVAAGRSDLRLRLPGPFHRKARIRAAYLARQRSSDQYRFLAEPVANSPARWDPCAAVRWRFNPRHAPAGGLQTVSQAMAAVSAATGLSLIYEGTTSTVPSSAYVAGRTSPVPIVIGWSTSAESDLLAGTSASTVGVARVSWAGGSTPRMTAATVALNSATSAPMSGANSWFTYTLHELGHAFGLAHIDTSPQIMNPVIPASLHHFAAGDRAGLYRLGASGCAR